MRLLGQGGRWRLRLGAARLLGANAAFVSLTLLLWLTGAEEACSLSAGSVLGRRQAQYHLPVRSNTERYPVAEAHQTLTSSQMHFTGIDHFTKENNSCNIEIDSQWSEISNQILPPSQPNTGSMEASNFQADSHNPCSSDQLDPSHCLPEFYHMNPDDIYTAAACGLLTDDDLLRASIAASLKESRMDQNSKLEVPKSSVSSLRLQQLQQMGFSTEKAVLALAASGKVEGAINLLVEDQVGEDAIVTTKGKAISS
ncbi:rhomboid domain-containing protein 3 isoform X3 [Pristis pectinata]|uniref:rhomboid domain-containing protein 3 isoform X3 n=1 Tax=Pristis pectinata TaxID=685728 RepID=UPI00223CE1BF|nr:rhomboid domain-containing protein 3 isoform X3 [Pristis pectinata]